LWVPGHKGGESETVLGKWLTRGGNREKVLIATKVGMEMPGITAPIASATSLTQLNELMKSLELTLDPSAIELLNRASA
jgi:aryl-alcohol dehydrogenase-like predicted oxidoreductase